MKHSTDIESLKEVLERFEQPVTSRVAAPLVHIHYKTLEEMARAGQLPAVKLGKSWLFRMSLLNKWLNSQLESNVSASQRGE